MRLIPTLLLAASAFLSATIASADTNVRALLVLASNQPGQKDSRLAAYEPNLRRILRFESYRLAGEGSTSVAAGGQGALSLGQGHALKLEAEKADAKSARLRVTWEQDGRTVMNTGLLLRPGVPAVLGGPASPANSGVWAVILIED